MKPHEWFVEQRTDYVIRALEEDEERSFTEHLAGCAECRDAIAAVERELAWLPMAVTPAHPRPGLTRSLVEGALGRHRRQVPWLVPASLAASLVLALGAWYWALGTVRAFERELVAERAEMAHELRMARDTLEIFRQAVMVRHADIAMGNKRGGIVIFADQETHRWNVLVYGLPASTPGEVCQFWFVTDGGMVKSVAVHSDGTRPAFLTLPMPETSHRITGAALTMEPEGSTSPAPEGPELAHLAM